MINTIEMKYKAQTGCSPYLEIEAQILNLSIDERILQGMRASEIIDMIKYDNKKNEGWGVFISQMPKEFECGDDLKIVTPEYIQWLEDQLKNKLP